MKNRFETELAEIIEKLGVESENDPLCQLHNYNDEMTISQVVKFFNRQGIPLTKTMIQNYVRVGILPPPCEKRYYKREHLILLTLTDRFKNIYSLGEIRSSYTSGKASLGECGSEPANGAANEFADECDNSQKMMRLYNNYLEICKKAAAETEESILRDMEYLKKLSLDGESIDEGIDENIDENIDMNESLKTLLLLTLMSRSMAMKRMVEMILEK